MKCPVCGTPELLMTERQGVEIDYCPSCRGVWLDRGELDKLIERTEGHVARLAPAAGSNDQGRRHDAHASQRGDDRRDRTHGDDDRSRQHDRPRKKKSLFEMFDFD